MTSTSRQAAVHTAQDRFIAAWGQMGSTWGISRTMAEVHALLFISGEPMCTDDVMDRLKISRGNASMSLRALVDWGVVSRVHKRGDRKEYFSAEQDVWTLMQAILRERVKREIRPVLGSLYEIRELTPGKVGAAATGASGSTSGADGAIAQHNQRLDDMIELVRTIEEMSAKLLDLPSEQVRQTASAITEASGR